MKKENPINVKIEHTYDYDKFKLIGINREVDQKHVMSIAEAIEMRNLLHLFPLIVNKEWEVMDGQHRLSSVKVIESSKALQLPIYYIMDPQITLDDISLLNSNKINWKNIDYVNYFAGKGLQAYIDLAEFIKAHPQIPLSTCITLLSSHRRDAKKLKSGDLICDNVEKAYYIISCAYELRERMRSSEVFWKSGFFLSALKAVIQTKKYQHHIMMASPRNKSEHWSRQHSAHSYVFEINSIYNFGRSDREKIDFLKLTRQTII